MRARSRVADDDARNMAEGARWVNVWPTGPERVHRARRRRRLRVLVRARELSQVGIWTGFASPGKRAVDRRNPRRSDESAILGVQCVRGSRALGLAAFWCRDLHSAARREKRRWMRAGLHSLSPA